MIRRLDGLLQGDYRTLLRGAGPRPGRPARVPAPRRRAPHRLERHGAPADAARARVHRRPRDGRLVPAGPEPARSTSAPASSASATSRPSSSPCWRACSRATATASARCSTAASVDSGDPAAQRPPPCAAPAAQRCRRGRPRGAKPGTTQLRDLLDRPPALIQRRSTVFVVSDFISEPGWERPLALLAQRHEVVAVRLFDPLELELPDLGLVTAARRRNRRAVVGRHA